MERFYGPLDNKKEDYLRNPPLVILSARQAAGASANESLLRIDR